LVSPQRGREEEFNASVDTEGNRFSPDIWKEKRVVHVLEMKDKKTLKKGIISRTKQGRRREIGERKGEQAQPWEYLFWGF